MRGYFLQKNSCKLTLAPLERILSSHPLLHAAEGQMSREAVSNAAAAAWLALSSSSSSRAPAIERSNLDQVAAGVVHDGDG